MDSLTRLLLLRYSPNDPRVAAPLEAIAKSTGYIVIMSANDFSESVIFAEITKFNRESPAYMSHSFTLPVTTNGIPAGSWVLTAIEDH